MKAFVLIAVLVLLGPGQAMVQDTPDIERFFPRRGFMLSGSGGTSYNAVFADGAVSLNVSAYKTSSPTRSLLTFTGVGGNVILEVLCYIRVSLPNSASGAVDITRAIDSTQQENNA